MFFFWYLIPLFVCILSGAYFFTEKHKNVAAGLILMVLGFTPLFNIFIACIGLTLLVVMACKN